jgi:uncharacterized OsmC-like protein
MKSAGPQLPACRCGRCTVSRTHDANETTLVVTHGGGMRYNAEIRGHRIETDQPVYGRGEDAAAMPLELLTASLGTCIALYVRQFCLARSIPTEGMRIEVVARPEGPPKRIGRFDIRVVLPASVPEEYRPMLERVARTCPVHNTLMHAPDFEIEIIEALEPVLPT